MKSPAPQHRSHAFTFWDFLIVVVTAVLVVTVLIPMLNARRSGRVPAQRINCVSNLKQIGFAFRVWANEHDERFPMQVFTNQGGSMEYVGAGPVFLHFLAISNELISPKLLLCVADNTRGRRATNFAELRDQNLSYFVGVDAQPTNSNHWLAGDHNLSTNGVAVRSGLLPLTTNHQVGWTKRVHNGAGNVGFADGSVGQLVPYSLQQSLQMTGLATNRLAIP